MSDPRFPDENFFKADGSGDLGCVEVAMHATGVGVRDSKNKTGPVLIFTPHEWDVFLTGAKAGEFDRTP